MLSQFLTKQLERAKYKILPDSTYFASIPGLRGIWANAHTLEDCRAELQSVLEDWLLLRLRTRATIPGLRLPPTSRVHRRPVSSRYA